MMANLKVKKKKKGNDISVKTSINDHVSQHVFGYPQIKAGLPWWLRGLSVCLQCGRPEFDP